MKHEDTLKQEKKETEELLAIANVTEGDAPSGTEEKSTVEKKQIEEASFDDNKESEEKKSTNPPKNKKNERDNVQSGMLVSVHEKILDTTPKGEKRERTQIFRGMVLARKHGTEPGASITVRKQSGDVNVEKIFPVYSPIVEKIVIEKRFQTRRSKLYFLRDTKKRLREIK